MEDVLTLRAEYLFIFSPPCANFLVLQFTFTTPPAYCWSIGKIRFHWIFSESHHGKGEHDGHGATVKARIKFFVLGGMQPNYFFSLQNTLSYLIIAEDHFVDNEQEALDFINSGAVANTTAFLMPMSSNDEEQDCTALAGSNSYYEFRYQLHCSPIIIINPYHQSHQRSWRGLCMWCSLCMWPLFRRRLGSLWDWVASQKNVCERNEKP